MSRRSQPRRVETCRALLVPFYLRLVVQDCVQERIMDLDRSVVGDEAELAELVHEKTDTRACRADHFRQFFLGDVRRDGLWGPFLSKFCEEKEKAREPFLAGIE